MISLAAPSLVQDVHGCGDILYVAIYVAVQRPSPLKGVEIGLASSYFQLKLVFVLVPVLMLGGMFASQS